MSRLNSLLRQVVAMDPRLGDDLKREVDALSGRRSFGLNFERHIPETAELPNRPVRRGDKVRFLSKWLAMMERRLKLAKRLLNPARSVMIVAVDEREVHRLGLLLEQTFEAADMQMVTNVINAKGVVRPG